MTPRRRRSGGQAIAELAVMIEGLAEERAVHGAVIATLADLLLRVQEAGHEAGAPLVADEGQLARLEAIIARYQDVVLKNAVR